MSEVGVRKAAVLLLALGQDEAAEVMKYLDPREVQKIGKAMSTMSTISNADLNSVLEDFEHEVQHNTAFGVDSEDYIRQVLTKALGDDNAGNLLNQILVTHDATGIDSLKWMSAPAIADLIRFEHPQIIATILVQLEPPLASEVLTELSERTRGEAILRIATLDGVQPAALHELNEVLTSLLAGSDNLNKKALGGIRATASIMNFLSSEIESTLMGKLKDFDEEVAQQITDHMFVFDNISDLEDRDVQIMLREIPSEPLIIALKGAKSDIKNKIFKNMSKRAAEMMQEDLESKSPVRLSDVDKQQKVVLQIIRRLADEGQINLKKKGSEDDFI